MLKGVYDATLFLYLLYLNEWKSQKEAILIAQSKVLLFLVCSKALKKFIAITLVSLLMT